MSLPLLLVSVVVLSFVAGHFLTRYLARYVSLSGAEFLLVGVLIGPGFSTRMLTAEALAHLEPVVSLLLGLIGFIAGLAARKQLGGPEAAGVGFLASVATLVGAALVFMPLLAALGAPVTAGDPLFERELVSIGGWVLDVHVSVGRLQLALVLAAAATVSSAARLDSDPLLRRSSGLVTDLMRAGGASAQITAVVVFGLVLATSRAADEASRFAIGVTEWGLAAAGSGVIAGLLFSLFIGRESDPGRIFLATVGAVTFAAGIGAGLGISPLFVNLVAGLVVAVTSPHADVVRREAERLRHPVFVLLMIFAGAMWRPTGGMLLLVPALYLAARMVLRRTTMPLAARAVLECSPSVPRLGRGLMAQGGLAVAIGVSYALREAEQSGVVLTTVIVGTLVSDLWSVRALRRLLVDAGECGSGGTDEAPDALGAADHVSAAPATADDAPEVLADGDPATSAPLDSDAKPAKRPAANPEVALGATGGDRP